MIEEASDADRDAARECLEWARGLVKLGCDLVILDEVSHAVNLGLISVEDVLSVIKTKKPHVEIILTGRDMPQELIDIADLVTEMRCVRHPYECGIKARLGIEY